MLPLPLLKQNLFLHGLYYAENTELLQIENLSVDDFNNKIYEDAVKYHYENSYSNNIVGISQYNALASEYHRLFKKEIENSHNDLEPNVQTKLSLDATFFAHGKTHNLLQLLNSINKTDK